ncbi:hypothetical protein [Xenorhabdus griffiniae]|uniref:hypothetical protein n=1 Tax=Xenorhabdus griffiniae TaxID=351672 RepID=UPI00235906DC|nr:hypothetical protein [Xenorhabdus griffiniae]MDC9605630.1 hypothetical protein [Xenorhabdus griffiniae]
MSQSTLTIDIKYNTESLNQLESQLEHIAELMERIQGRNDNEVEKLVGFAGKIFVKSATDPAKINQAHDNHLRQIVREEIRQFVVRESERGGLFSRW